VKFLVDNQLPAALARFIAARGHESSHVLELRLAQATDGEICRRAELDEMILVSKDEDFFHLAVRSGATLRLIWVRMGNCRKRALLSSFERAWPRIMDSLAAGDRVVELR
jgi:predicted nuclease of predicted toxin-antitoxin system